MTEEQAPVLFGKEGSPQDNGWGWEGKGWSARAVGHGDYYRPEVHWRAVLFIDPNDEIESDICYTAQSAATELEDSLRGIRDALADAFAVEQEKK